jgi:uncharacterized protein YndB with AHSA1/START domain
VTDAILVRAPVGVVYRALTDLDGWPQWLDGCGSARLPRHDGPGDGHALVLPNGRRRWRLALTVHGWRHDLGVHWEVRGDVVLTAEWWLEARPEGTVVHHVVHGAPSGRRAVRRVRRHRRVMMLTMQALKDHLELAVALASGRIP